MKVFNVLVLCTGNSCRSILGEALLNHIGEGEIRAFSAGSFPTGNVNPSALATLADHGLSIDGYSSQSWDEFDDHAFDIVITVCDNAAGETCPVYLNNTIKAHWGLPDPANVIGTKAEIKTAFENTYSALESRIKKMLVLPLSELSDQELTIALNKIGDADSDQK